MQEKLMTPGPTAIPREVFEAMAHPAMHHRTPEFREIFLRSAERFQSLVGNDNLPIFLASSGTGGMESVLLNLCRPGEQIITLNAGKFGERWGLIGNRLELNVREVKAEWGRSFDPATIESALLDTPEAHCICLQHSETSTCVLHPIEEIVALIRRHNPEIFIVLDVVSSLATLPFSMSEADVDVTVGGSQKALMLPPGLCMVSLNQRAWKKVERQADISPVRSLYFDLLTERKSQEKGSSAWTPAMNIILGLDRVFQLLDREGLDNVFSRHARASKSARTALHALGYRMLAPDHPAPGATGGLPPESIDPEEIRARLLKQHGIRIAGGQGCFKGKIIRIGHMGYFTDALVRQTLLALEEVSLELGAAVEKGAVAAALNN